jgi:hypothetical protein
VLAVTTVNMLGSASQAPVKLPYPADYSPRSILDPIGLGQHRDGSVAEISIREDSVLIVARKGGGKTSLLDGLTLGIGRCKDALTWHIDMNGGGMSQMWLHPWLEGRTDRPAIDWCASTPEEALLMVTVALAIAIDRKSSYRTYKAQANAKLLPISAKLPEIVIEVDEAAEVMSPANRDPILRQVRDGLEQIHRIGRNEAVNVAFTALRPTQDMISPNILKQSAIKIGMYGMDEADLGHLYGWRRGISMDDLPVQGCAFLGIGTTTPRAWKSWFLQPDQIQQAAIAIAGYRPELDDASADVADAEFDIDLGGKNPVTMTRIYATRYERMRQAFTGQTAVLPTTTTTTTRPATTTTAATQTTTPAALRVLKGGGGAASWPDPLPAITQPAVPASASAWPDPLPGRPVITPTARPAIEQTRPAARPVPQLITDLTAIVRVHPGERIHTEVLVSYLAQADPYLTPKKLSELLAPCGVTPLAQAWIDGDRRGRGYIRADILHAADAIAAGEITPPAAVYAWPPDTAATGT